MFQPYINLKRTFQKHFILKTKPQLKCYNALSIIFITDFLKTGSVKKVIAKQPFQKMSLLLKHDLD